MTLVTNLNMKNGLAIIGRKQTAGVGRNKNQVCIRINNSFCSHFQFIRFFDAYKLKKYLQWLSPDGCALFSLQLHIPLSSPLGQKVPLIQHLVSVAIVNSIVKLDDYKVIGFWCLLNIYLHKHYKLNTDKTIFFNYVVPHFNQWQICRVNNNVKQIHFSLFLFFRKQKLDIRLKWPNDMYAYGNTKIGGLVVNTELNAGLAICNVGVGFNLNNSIPTTCVNDMIKAYNIKNNTKLPYLDYECFFANVFNEIEELLYVVQTHSDFDYLYDLYYKLWLHSDAEIVIIDADGNKKLATIIGIDDFGYLSVKQPNKEPESVHPDGNTFDILRGLISAKHF